jgi:hypothetical protein
VGEVIAGVGDIDPHLDGLARGIRRVLERRVWLGRFWLRCVIFPGGGRAALICGDMGPGNAWPDFLELRFVAHEQVRLAAGGRTAM